MTKFLGGFSNDIHGLIYLDTSLFNGTESAVHIPPAHKAEHQPREIIPKPAILLARILEFESTARPNLSIYGNKSIEQLVPRPHGSELI